MKVKLLFLPWHHIDHNVLPWHHLDFKRGERSEVELSSEKKFIPLGIATLTAFMRKRGFQVDQDDLHVKAIMHNRKHHGTDREIYLHYFNEDYMKRNNLPWSEASLEAECEKILALTDIESYDVIGFSLPTADNPSVVTLAKALGERIKEKYGKTVIAGECGEESAVRDLLEGNALDCAIYTESFGSAGEVGLLNFCSLYEKGGDVSKIPGAVYLKDDKLVHTIGFDDLTKEERTTFSKPEFDGLPMDLYRYAFPSKGGPEGTAGSGMLILPYFFTYGCPNKCAFCYYSKRPLLGVKDPMEVVDDLEQLSEQYQTKYFYFLNTEINVTKKYAMTLAKEILRRNLKILWTDCATFKGVDDELLETLREAGAARLVWGLEVASPKMLEYIRKGTTDTQAEKVLKKSHELGIWNEVLLICGFPYERQSDVNASIEFLERNRDYVHGFTLNKFWVDGLFRDFPDDFDIRLRRSRRRDTYRNWTTKPFDEIKGFSWKTKIKMTERSFDKIKETIDRLGIPTERPIHSVFKMIAMQRESGGVFSRDEVYRLIDELTVDTVEADCNV